MSLQEIVEFAQAHFGDNLGVPNLPEVRPRLPPWLEGRIEDAVPIEEGEQPIIEGSPGATTASNDVGKGTSVEELFAYYLPFHFYNQSWGTYIRAYGIERLARILTAQGPVTQPAASLAYLLLLEHERLHFLVELAASRLEVIAWLPSYRPYFSDPSAARHEEALANAQAFSWSKRGAPSALVAAAKSWMSNQGHGYRDFHRWLGHSLRLGKREAAEHMIKPVREQMDDLVPRAGSIPDRPGEILFEEPRRLQPPTYLVVDRSVPWLRIAKPFPKHFGLQVHVHTNDHNPPHIHVVVLRRARETRYAWPKLRPLPGDPALSRSDEKSLRAYVESLGDEIDAKVRSVPWT